MRFSQLVIDYGLEKYRLLDMSDMGFKSLREECLQANIDLVGRGLVDLTFGNVSVLDAENSLFAIKPSGVDYSQLVPSDIVIVNIDGKVIDGHLNPSSDTPTHRFLYRAFSSTSIRSIVHTHSRHAVSFSQAGRELPCLGTTHADYFYGPVPVTRVMTKTEVDGEYEWETGKVIAECFESRDPLKTPAVLVQSHGPFAWGESGAKAVENAFALEVVAEMALNSLALNPTVSSVPDHLLNKHFNRKHGDTAYYGQKQ